MDISIRAAVKADLPTLKTFEQGIVEAERPYDPTINPDPVSYYDVGKMIKSDDTYVAVAELGGKVIASGYVQKRPSLHYISPPFHAFIGFLYVTPEQRGKGVNKQLLDSLFSWAKDNDLPKVHLKVYPENAPAVKAYEKAGFKPYFLEMRVDLDAATE